MPDPSIIETWERLVRYHRTTTTAMDQRLQTTFGHSLDAYDVLHQISVHGGPIRMGDLAENLLVANSSCNRIVGRLVDDGLVERSHGESDGRVVLVDLTQAGNALRRRMAAVHGRDIQARFGEPLTATEAADIDAILQRLLANPTTEPRRVDSARPARGSVRTAAARSGRVPRAIPAPRIPQGTTEGSQDKRR